jgi:hypothetical protein
MRSVCYHAEPTMEDGVESLGADLKCSESSPDRYCAAVVSLKVRIEPSRRMKASIGRDYCGYLAA